MLGVNMLQKHTLPLSILTITHRLSSDAYKRAHAVPLPDEAGFASTAHTVGLINLLHKVGHQ
jgi:hypothetical protein